MKKGRPIRTTHSLAYWHLAILCQIASQQSPVWLQLHRKESNITLHLTLYCKFFSLQFDLYAHLLDNFYCHEALIALAAASCLS